MIPSPGSGARALLRRLLTPLLLALGVTAGAETPRIDLLFASTRAISGDDDPGRFLGNDNGPLVYGQCTVRYEESPREGRWTGYGDFFLPGDNREVVAADTIDEAAFLQQVQSGGERTVLFVHGYAYGFGRGCRRVSDLQVVLGSDVRVVLFSWPSTGNVLRYGGDRTALTASIPALLATIDALATTLGPERLVVVAHSMGTQGVMGALAQLPVADGRRLARDLVLLAPDYGAEDFRERFALVRDRFDRVTLYTSGNDVLLGLSAMINGGQRLGQGGKRAVVLPGMETIDLTELPRHHPAAHEYQYYNPHVVSDLVELLRDGRGATERRYTTPCQREGVTYWMLTASGEDGDRRPEASCVSATGRPQAATPGVRP